MISLDQLMVNDLIVGLISEDIKSTVQNIRLEDVFENDKSHTKRLSEN